MTNTHTHTHTHTHARTHARTHTCTHTHFSCLLGNVFEGLNYVEDFLVQASTEPKLIPVASWIIEWRNGLETCMGVEPNQVEILITSHNKNMVTADGTTRSVVSLLRFCSCWFCWFDGLCNILSLLKLTDLIPSTDTFPTFTFTYLSHHTLLLLCVTS